MSDNNSRDIAKAAFMLALSDNREDEIALKGSFKTKGIKTAAVDFGGEFVSTVPKIIERAVVAAKREGLIQPTHIEEGAIAGATHEALSQASHKAVGFNVGGKIGMAKKGEHLSIAIFIGIGLLHLNDVAVGIGHRAVPK